MFITRISIHNPVFAAMLMIGLCILGLYSYHKLDVENLPDISFPIVVVQTQYPGATAESVELEVTKKIEQEVSTISGVKKVTSKSYAGSSMVVVEFYLDIQVNVAVQNVRDKVALIKPLFNHSVEDPTVAYFNPDDIPIYSLAVFSRNDSVDLAALSLFVNDVLASGIERVKGVGKVNLVGGEKPQLSIIPNLSALDSRKISINEFVNAINRQLVSVSAGSVFDGQRKQALFVGGDMHSQAALESIVVDEKNNALTHLSDVAEVFQGVYEQQSVALVNSQRAIALDVIKVPEGNTINIVADIETFLSKTNLPEGIEIKVVRNYSQEVKNSFDDVKATLLEGAFLTIVIVFLFLQSWRSTVITGLTLPISIIGTFFFMYFAGFTLNVMTMMALSLSIGILIDDAIVVRENIVRHLKMGKGHFQAAYDATQEIGLAVLSTTLCIVAVFLPVAFMDGIIGQFFFEFGITVSIAVIISMFVSFILDPMLSSHWYDPSITEEKGRIANSIDGYGEKILTLYTRLLEWALVHKKKTLAFVSAVFIASFFLLPSIGAEFTPAVDNSAVSIDVKTYSGATLAYTQDKLFYIDSILHTFPEVVSSYAVINSWQSAGENKASILVKLVAKNQRKLSQIDIEHKLRQRLNRIAGVEISVSASQELSDGKPVKLNVRGDDLEEISAVAERLQEKLRAIDGLVDVDVSSDFSAQLKRIRIDRDRAFELGVSEQDIATMFDYLFAGSVINRFEDEDGESYDVRVILSSEDRAEKGVLNRLNVHVNRNGERVLIPLGTFVQLVDENSVSQINRSNMQREVTVSANVYGQSLGDVTGKIKQLIDAEPASASYDISLGGAAEDMAETAVNALVGILLGLVFIYLILGSLFNSFSLPLTIMTSLPLSLIGVILGLYLSGSTFNIFSIIGFIMLMGLVTKNSILLVDFINDAIKAGDNVHDAVIKSGVTRLKPIVMTTLAMIFGMLPLALGVGEGSEQRAPMAHAIIGGLITSTLLTLVIVPVLYTVLHKKIRPSKAEVIAP